MQLKQKQTPKSILNSTHKINILINRVLSYLNKLSFKPSHLDLHGNAVHLISNSLKGDLTNSVIKVSDQRSTQKN